MAQLLLSTCAESLTVLSLGVQKLADRILVVDDDPSILDLLRVLLESEGYSVEAFGSAPQALKAAVKSPPAAAIIDLMMPEMSGLDLLRALRYDTRTHDIPVLICSAYYENLASTGSELDQPDVRRLRKPFHVGELLDLVSELIDKRRSKKPKRIRSGSPGPGQISAFAAYHV